MKTVLFPFVCFILDVWAWWDKQILRYKKGGIRTMIGEVAWLAPALAFGMGLLWAGSFLLYTVAFQKLGMLQLNPNYLFRLAFGTPFMAGLLLSLAISLLRMWLFGIVGAQRTWFLEPVINLGATLVVVAVLREGMKPSQWLGASLIMSGMFFLVRK